ncbi:1597_t:CDS:2, partial [Entrophospora sp. SA101]
LKTIDYDIKDNDNVPMNHMSFIHKEYNVILVSGHSNFPIHPTETKGSL